MNLIFGGKKKKPLPTRILNAAVLWMTNQCRERASGASSNCETPSLCRSISVHSLWGVRWQLESQASQPGSGTQLGTNLCCATRWDTHRQLGSLLPSSLPRNLILTSRGLSSPARAWTATGFCKARSVQSHFWAQKLCRVVYEHSISAPHPHPFWHVVAGPG